MKFDILFESPNVCIVCFEKGTFIRTLVIIQLKYTIEGVSKILVPRDQIYFPRRNFNCFIIPKQTLNF